MYSCCKALHPFWPTTCFCRGEIRSRELEATKTRELAEINRKALRNELKAKKAASSPPNRFKFKSVKRSLGNDNGETKMGPGAKKGKVANEKEVGNKVMTRSEAPGLKDPKYKFLTENERAAAKVDTKAKVDTDEASAKFDFRLVKKKFEIPSQNGARTTTENLELKVKDLEAKVKEINRKKKEKAEKEKREANHSKLKEKYKQLQETFKRLKKEEREVKLQKSIQNLAEKCKNLEEKLHVEKSEINLKTGAIDEENVKKTTKKKSKKGGDQKNRNKG